MYFRPQWGTSKEVTEVLRKNATFPVHSWETAALNAYEKFNTIRRNY